MTIEERVLTTSEIAKRFNELAQQEKWFEVQDELFADNVRSMDPPTSPYFKYAEGKANVRKKGQDWVSKVRDVHERYTTSPIIGSNHFAVGRRVDITVEGFGRVKIDEIMLYHVQNGQIVSEQFFY